MQRIRAVLLIVLLGLAPALLVDTTAADAATRPGLMAAWGANGYGQVGNGTGINAYVPAQVVELRAAVAVAAGGSHSIALLADGAVWAWGSNFHGELGNGRYGSTEVPVQVSDLNDTVAVAAGYLHSPAVSSTAPSGHGAATPMASSATEPIPSATCRLK